MEGPLIFAVGRAINTIERLEYEVGLLIKQGFYRFPAPKIIAAGLTLAHTILARKKSAFGVAHLVLKPAEGSADGILEKRILAQL